MCGIYGWQLDEGALDFETRYALAIALAAYNDRRGGHSWGFAADGEVTRGLGRAVCKTGGIGAAGLGDMALAQTLVGHARFATTGARTTTNAHPFDLGRVVGAHNGVVFNHGELNKRYGRSFKVDSQHLFAHLAEGRKLSDVRAYGAVEYWLAGHPHTVRLGRFNGGVLAVAQLSCGVVWSSDANHLEAALLHAGFDERDYRLVPVREDVLYAVRGGRISATRGRLGVADRAPVKVEPRTENYTPAISYYGADAEAVGAGQRRTASKRGELLFGGRARLAKVNGKKMSKKVTR